jgi:uncharacterized protein YceK
MEVNGYKYTTEQDAQSAVKSCNDYYGIPIKGDTTENWCMYQIAELNTPIFWYIVFDESLLPILGNPTEFEVTQETI